MCCVCLCLWAGGRLAKQLQLLKQAQHKLQSAPSDMNFIVLWSFTGKIIIIIIINISISNTITIIIIIIIIIISIIITP